MKIHRALAGFAGMLALLVVSSASAVLSPTCITNKNAGDCAIAEAQIGLTVTQFSPTQLRWQFTNAGPTASFIADLYWEDRQALSSMLLSIDLFVQPVGVNFSENATPANPPGIPFNTALSADSDSPIAGNGVNPGESLGVIMNLVAGVNFAQFSAAWIAKEIRVAAHIQGFASGGSECVLWDGGTITPTPEPTTAMLLAIGVFGLMYRRRVTARTAV